LFVWYDGPLVQGLNSVSCILTSIALKNGDFFLMDEISLADDAVLERINSVLEPHRLLVLAEKVNSCCN
jgi:midasin